MVKNGLLLFVCLFVCLYDAYDRLKDLHLENITTEEEINDEISEKTHLSAPHDNNLDFLYSLQNKLTMTRASCCCCYYLFGAL